MNGNSTLKKMNSDQKNMFVQEFPEDENIDFTYSTSLEFPIVGEETIGFLPQSFGEDFIVSNENSLPPLTNQNHIPATASAIDDWPRIAIAALVKERLRVETLFQSEKSNHTALWEQIAKSLTSHNIYASSLDCKSKFQQMLCTYKNVVETNYQYKDHRSLIWEWFNEFDATLQYKPSSYTIKPHLLGSTLDDPESNDCSQSDRDSQTDAIKDETMSDSGEAEFENEMGKTEENDELEEEDDEEIEVRAVDLTGNNEWPKDAIKSLLYLRSEMDENFDATIPGNNSWTHLSLRMYDAGYICTHKDCSTKFKHLLTTYRDILTAAKNRKNIQTDWEWFGDVDALYKKIFQSFRKRKMQQNRLPPNGTVRQAHQNSLLDKSNNDSRNETIVRNGDNIIDLDCKNVPIIDNSVDSDVKKNDMRTATVPNHPAGSINNYDIISFTNSIDPTTQLHYVEEEAESMLSTSEIPSAPEPQLPPPIIEIVAETISTPSTSTAQPTTSYTFPASVVSHSDGSKSDWYCREKLLQLRSAEERRQREWEEHKMLEREKISAYNRLAEALEKLHDSPRAKKFRLDKL